LNVWGGEVGLWKELDWDAKRSISSSNQQLVKRGFPIAFLEESAEATIEVGDSCALLSKRVQ